MKSISAVLIIVMLASAFLWIGCESGAAEGYDKTKIAVKIAAVEYTRHTVPIHTSGLLAATTETKLSFKIGGIVERIFVNEGQSVRSGQLLAKLNLAEIEAQVQQARSGFEKAERDLLRVERLYADSVVTLEQRQDAKTALDLARSGLKIAEFNLKYATIYAPSDGRIMKRFGEANELTGAGQPLFLFASRGRDWIVRAGVTDVDLVHLQLGDSASVSFDPYPGRYFPAYVNELAEGVDPMSGTFEVELTLANPDVRLISGFTADLTIFSSESEDVALIPASALVEGDGPFGYVFVPADNHTRASRREVSIAHIGDEYLAVRLPDQKISEVITSGSAYLTEGATIFVGEGAIR